MLHGILNILYIIIIILYCSLLIVIFQMYNDSRAMCNTLWGPSFVYSDDVSTSPTKRCLVPWFNENSEVNPNEAAVQRIFQVPSGARGAFVFTFMLIVAPLVTILLLFDRNTLCGRSHALAYIITVNCCPLHKLYFMHKCTVSLWYLLFKSQEQ